MTIAGLLAEAGAERVIRGLQDLGIEAAAIWTAARSNDELDRYVERFGVGAIRSGVREAGFVSGLVKAVGLDHTGDSFLRTDLIELGIDDERAAYFAASLARGQVLVGIALDAEEPAVAELFTRAGADLGLVNGAGADHTIVLRREVINVSKRVVLDAVVTVRTELVTESKLLEVVLEREEYVIETRDLTLPGQPVTVVRIPLRHEEAVIDKRVVVTAEVRVRTAQEIETSQIRETVRYEVLRVEDPAGVVRQSLERTDGI